MKEKRHRTCSLLLAACVLLAAGLACGRQDEETGSTPAVVVVTATPGGRADPTAAPEPTSTPLPGGCADGMQFVADVSVPDGAVFGPNEPFIKTWRLRNAGTCDWSGYRAVFLDGEPMGTAEQDIPDMPAGEEFDLSIQMTSPGGAGSYTGRWQVRSPGGANLGTLTCVIAVAAAEEPEEEEPSEAPEETEAPPAAGAPAAPSNLRLGGWSMTTVTLAWDDNSADEDGFRVRHVGVGWLDPVGANVTELEIPLPPCGETYQFRVRAFNAAGDSEPSNTLDVDSSCPDLVIQNLVLDPNPVEVGEGLFTAEFDVVNVGNGVAAPSTAFWRILSVEGWSITCQVPQLAAGASHHCGYSWGSVPTNPANYGTRAVADHDGAVAEADEDNNELRETLQVRQP